MNTIITEHWYDYIFQYTLYKIKEFTFINKKAEHGQEPARLLYGSLFCICFTLEEGSQSIYNSIGDFIIIVLGANIW